MAGAGSKRDGQSSGKGGKSNKRKSIAIERQPIQLPPLIPSRPLLSHNGPLHVNEPSLPQPSREVNRSQPHITGSIPPIILPRPRLSPTGPLHINDTSLPHPILEVGQSQPHNTTSQPQSNESQPVNQETEQMMSPPANMTPATSFSTVGNGDDEHRMCIKPEADGKKQELSASQSASTDQVGDTNSASQLSEMDIWVQSIGGKKKGKVAGLGSLGRSVKALKHSTSTLPGEIDEMIKSQVHTSNANLYAQLQEERCKNKKMRKELDLLKKYVNFNASSSNELSSQEDNQESEDGSDNDSDNVNESGSNPGNVNESDYN
ncbi:hypothetical protein A4A49_58223 [Nicotiana attenuata]|uniref:Uncharacterized protein n=1 Tax=Nicotiana attenuata TaxID=49451 RepID=A0A314KRV4_NICAT|nr:hypothetical protein A4A49_58223 [Nicotiana attenuata]